MLTLYYSSFLGVFDGLVMTIPNVGNAGEQSGPAGNLQVAIHVEPSAYFQRDGPHIRVTVPLSIDQAVLGSSVTVETIDGPVEIRVRPGTQPGEEQRLRNRGIADAIHHQQGHQFVTFQVKLPKYAFCVAFCAIRIR